MCVQLTTVGTSVAAVKTVDADTGVNALVEYLVIPGNVPEEELQKGRVSDGVKHFKMKSSNSGEIILQKGLDFEKVQKYFVTIQATVRIKFNVKLSKYIMYLFHFRRKRISNRYNAAIHIL